MSAHLNNIVLLFIFVTGISAAPQFFSCISYMEEDGSMQDDFDDYLATSSQIESEILSREIVVTSTSLPNHRRICQSDYTFCFALWRQTASGTYIEKQGCWKESTEHNATCNQAACISTGPTSGNNSLYYCCCSGDVCNKNVSIRPHSIQVAIPKTSNFEDSQYQDGSISWIVLFWYFVVTSAILLSILGMCYFCHNIQKKCDAEEAPLAPSGPGYSSNLRNVDNINLVGILGSGKYGTVMKGLLHDEEVAVKIFPEAHYQYYINERNIYSLPLMDDCTSLLTYFGYDEHQTLEGKVVYKLVLSLASYGCLQDWLIANIMDFKNFSIMAKSITRGLSHLHTELRCGDMFKPCIAHRDLNSRNILVKSDLSCCIADFGFALKVFGSKYEYKGEVAIAETKSINEVGTLRYMAPELLEGAVNLRDCETSLKQMDVYALGLILWELATRCADFYPSVKLVPPYKEPYELEVGTHPTFDQMQALVVRHKARPLFPVSWGGCHASKLVRDTSEDCWDHDAEARLTSLCAEERMQEVAGLLPHLRIQTQAGSPLLNANNMIEHQNVDSSHKKLCEFPNVSNSLAKIAAFNLPPNKQIYLNTGDSRNELEIQFEAAYALSTEKNHLHSQQQLQPYQGMNPCQERNLAPVAADSLQVFVQKSKKHSFRSNENSFSCLEDDVSVEDLFSNSRKFAGATNGTSNMGHGFPKQHNTEKKLRGWHGVRALIQKRLFRKQCSNTSFLQQGNSDEKSNLVHSRATVTAVSDSDNSFPGNTQLIRAINDGDNAMHLGTARIPFSTHLHSDRPNKLHLSGISIRNIDHLSKSNEMGTLNSSSKADGSKSGNLTVRPVSRKMDGIPLHVVPRLFSTVMKNNGINNNEGNVDNGKPKMLSNSPHKNVNKVIRRQSSLEVFHEVFGRGSTAKLRDPSQRVKTPGDVPPSVRRIRASKTLSLYDDRMMGTSTLNNHIL